jgi:hypothetical protein
MIRRDDQTEHVCDAASVLNTTLDMLANDFDSMNSAELREMSGLPSNEADNLFEAPDRTLSVTASRLPSAVGVTQLKLIASIGVYLKILRNALPVERPASRLPTRPFCTAFASRLEAYVRRIPHLARDAAVRRDAAFGSRVHQDHVGPLRTLVPEQRWRPAEGSGLALPRFCRGPAAAQRRWRI